MIGFLKRNFLGLKVVLGGGLATSWVRRPGWQNPFSGLVDFLVDGPGEGPLLSFLNAPGPLKTEAWAPDYDPFPLGDYLAPGLILPYSASNGCYWGRCLFCPEKAEGNCFQPIAPGKSSGSWKTLWPGGGRFLIHLLDNAISPALFRELARQRFEAPWYGFARITEQLADLDFCLALKESGCVMLQLGWSPGTRGFSISYRRESTWALLRGPSGT